MMGTGLIMMGLRHTNRAELQGISPQDFHTYLNYLLGDHVWNLVARDANGDSVAHPPWAQVLAYERAVRKKRKPMKTGKATPRPPTTCQSASATTQRRLAPGIWRSRDCRSTPSPQTRSPPGIWRLSPAMQSTNPQTGTGSLATRAPEWSASRYWTRVLQEYIT